jgi:calcineurin-like phosphoesterase family protein
VKIWVTADQHFGHANIIKYCHRPVGSVAEMDETLIQRWNERIKPGDMVWHLGDVFFGKPSDPHVKEIRSRLNGGIFLVKGNHDRWPWGRYLSLGVDKMFQHPGDPGITKVGRRSIVLTHNPPASYERINTVLNILGEGAIWLHGHSHCQGSIQDPRVFDVGVDHQLRRVGFQGEHHFGHPLSLNQLLGESDDPTD